MCSRTSLAGPLILPAFLFPERYQLITLSPLKLKMLAFTLFIILAVSSSVSSYCRTADGDVVKYVDSAKTWDDARAHCRDSATPDASGDLVMDTTNGARAFLDAKVRC